MMANRTFLTGIGRINEHHRHANQGCLVVYELPELIEAPIMLFASLSLLNRASSSDALKVFQDYQRKSVFGLRNQLFGDTMVCIPMKSGLFARKHLQMPFGALCTTALKVCLKTIYLGSDLFGLLSREDFSCRIDSDVLDSKIDAHCVCWVNLLGFGNINHDTEIETSFAKNLIGLASDPIEPWSMVITDQDWKLDPTIESQQRDPIESLPGHDSLIVDNCSIRFKLWLDGFVALIGLRCLGDCPNSHLSGDTKLFPNLIINNLLQFDFVGCMKLKGFLSNEIAGGIELMHGLKKSLALLRCSFKFNLKSLHHSIDIKNLWKYKGYGRSYTAFLPGIRTAVRILPMQSQGLRTRASCPFEVKSS